MNYTHLESPRIIQNVFPSQLVLIQPYLLLLVLGRLPRPQFL